MEVELKYAIPDEKTMDAIRHDRDLADSMEEGSRSSQEFDGFYYDTPDFRLFRQGIAYRLRREGKKWVACLKWNDEVEDALFRRGELNVTLAGVSENPAPDLSVFSESEIGAEVKTLVGGEPLTSFLETRVVRRAFKIDTGKSILEVSLDKGKILTEKGEDAVRELEIELFTGSEQELLAIGAEIAKRYDLAAESRSKFARGLALLGKIK